MLGGRFLREMNKNTLAMFGLELINIFFPFRDCVRCGFTGQFLGNKKSYGLTTVFCFKSKFQFYEVFQEITYNKRRLQIAC